MNSTAQLPTNWQPTFGATRYIAEDNEGNAVNPNLPRTTVKMFYQLSVACHARVDGRRWC
ncbi:hypothetical protein OH690_00715 [Escherichia coli]|nr:hypothetical protein [Escherichia coli]